MPTSCILHNFGGSSPTRFGKLYVAYNNVQCISYMLVRLSRDCSESGIYNSIWVVQESESL